jgi:uncharacterized protein YcaQ
MPPLEISKITYRRFLLGRQGLWPGRRWRGKAGTAAAIRACEAVQMDPLVMVARSHDLVLHSRVQDYKPGHLDQLMYGERRFFDYGGGLFFYPMSELPYWRLHMRHRGEQGRWGPDFARANMAVLDQVRAALLERGPLGNRDLDGKFLETWSYRGGKDTSLAFFYLWLTGELMTHHRRGFERVYDFRANVAPKEFDYAATEAESEDFFALKGIAFTGLMREAAWRTNFADWIWRKVTPDEARRRLDQLLADRAIAPVKVEGFKETFLALTSDLPLIETLEAGKTPRPWKPLKTTTLDEVTFLAPLDIVSARGRARKVFDFDYVWEVYKPEHQRRWGYYVLPILYGDQLTARLDPKLDRSTQTLQIKGFWTEPHTPVKDEAFASALARGLIRFAEFLKAGRVDLSGMPASALKRGVKSFIQSESELKVK